MPKRDTDEHSHDGGGGREGKNELAVEHGPHNEQAERGAGIEWPASPLHEEKQRNCRVQPDERAGEWRAPSKVACHDAEHGPRRDLISKEASEKPPAIPSTHAARSSPVAHARITVMLPRRAPRLRAPSARSPAPREARRAPLRWSSGRFPLCRARPHRRRAAVRVSRAPPPRRR